MADSARTDAIEAMGRAAAAGDIDFCDHAALLDAIPTEVGVRLFAIEREGMEPKVEWCRKCRDELPYGAPGVRAEFIPWGRLFDRDDLVGPCCEKHLPKSVDLNRIDMYAVTDLRSVYRLSEGTDSG